MKFEEDQLLCFLETIAFPLVQTIYLYIYILVSTYVSISLTGHNLIQTRKRSGDSR